MTLATMNRYLYAVVALTLVLAAASCSKNSDDESVLTDNCYIRSFTLGQMSRAINSQSRTTGRDTTYLVAFSGAAYPMMVDQRSQTVTLVKPLPTGARTNRVLTTVDFVGALVHAPANDTTTWVAYDSKDSIDFTTPRIYRVLSTDGRSRRDYTVSLSVYDLDPDAYTWTVATEPMPAADGADVADMPSWRAPEAVTSEYDILDTVAYRQANGNWRVLLACRHRDAIDSVPLTMWSCLADGFGDGEWMRLDLSPDNPYGLVAYTRPHIVRYENRLVAFVEGSDIISVSSDNGITWKPDAAIKYPSALVLQAADGTPLAMEAVAHDGYIWLRVGDVCWTLCRNGYGS